MVGDFAKAPSGQTRLNQAISCEFILRHLFLRQQCSALKGSSTQLKTKGYTKRRKDLCTCASHIKYHVGVFFQVYFKCPIWIYWMRTAIWNLEHILMSFLVDSFLSSLCSWVAAHFFGVGGATSEGQFIFSLIPLSLFTEKLELYKQIWRNEMKEVLTIVGWLLSFDLVINLVIR